MTIVHIVLLEFKPTIHEKVVEDVGSLHLLIYGGVILCRKLWADCVSSSNVAVLQAFIRSQG